METKMAAAKQYIDNQGLNRTMQYGNAWSHDIETTGIFRV